MHEAVTGRSDSQPREPAYSFEEAPQGVTLPCLHACLKGSKDAAGIEALGLGV